MKKNKTLAYFSILMFADFNEIKVEIIKIFSQLSKITLLLSWDKSQIIQLALYKEANCYCEFRQKT